MEGSSNSKASRVTLETCPRSVGSHDAVDWRRYLMKGKSLERLGGSLLDQKEMKLAKHLALLLGNEKYDAASLIAEILPKYWKKKGNRRFTIGPVAHRSVFRTLYYLHTYADKKSFQFRLLTRLYISQTCQHLEGCLEWLAENTPGISKSLARRPFGPLVNGLEEAGVLPSLLATQLMAFNSAANIPAKHMKVTHLDSDLDKRTFSLLDASLALIMMRKLSIQMFDILRNKGVAIPQWKDFKEEWLSWNKLVLQQ